MSVQSKNLRGYLAKIMLVIMVFTLLPNTFTVNTQAVEGKKGEYEIYPVPQSIEYGKTKITLDKNANVIFEEGIDISTKNRLFEVLSIKGISYEVGTEIRDDRLNFLVGLNGSKKVVDNYFESKGLKDENHFSKIDSHIVTVKDNVIGVLGKDTDSAFYGITSLKLIFKQIDNNEIKELLIKDYSDGFWRGFIEGYYGIPWSHENRKDLMEFGGDFKMNSYIFAPKDDEYHSLKWRDPYPDEKLEELRELAEVGAKTKNKFIWTIHPFLKDGMKFDTEENYQNDLKKIITKFEQLYKIGVRQFGVLADDAEGEAADQVRLMKDLEKWRLEKKDVYSFLFVPKVYTKESAGGDVNNEYLKTISQMPESTEILWTGDTILGYVKEDSFSFFKEAVGREPFMWLNWPVNDINNKRLLMGKGEMLDKNVTNFRGIVTNPMQEAQASKVALFAIADYGWNRSGFDMDKSWKDSFKYIEPDASEELYTFAKHMSDPAPTWHGLTLEESEELRPVIQDFIMKLFRGQSISEESKVVLAEYQEILDATNNYAKKSKNEAMKKEIKGWVDSLRDLSEATMAYINAAVALEQGKNEEAIKYYNLAEAKYTSSRSYRIDLINNGKARPEPGSRHLIPFAKDLSRILSEKVTGMINPNDTRVTLFPSTNMGYNLYWGHVQNIVDGDNARLSTMWMRRSAKEGDYVALEFNEVTEINNVIFEQGEPGAGDKFNFVKFQYSMDGETWSDLDGAVYGPQIEKIVIENLNVKAKHIRVIPTGEIKNNWISVREFSVNKDDSVNIKRNAYTNVDELSKGKVNIYPSNAILGGLSEVTLAKNEYVGIKLNKIREITNILANITNKDKLSLQTSINGVEWSNVMNTSDVVNARYIRVINNSESEVKFNIENLTVEYSDKDVTFEVTPGSEEKFAASNLIDGKLNTSFKPQANETNSGSLVYKVSDNLDMDEFTIIQNESTISNAVVSVRTAEGWTEVGTLSNSINKFDTSKFNNVFDIKIEWNGVLPTLQEMGIGTNNEIVVEVNKTELQNVINEAEKLDSEDYTSETWTVLEEKLNAAKEVLEDSAATQEEVDKAVEELKNAMNALVEKNENIEAEKPNNGSNSDNNQKVPTTGDKSKSMTLVIVSFISFAALVALRKRSAN